MYKILFPTRRQFNNSFSKVHEGENISSTVNKETEMLSFFQCYLCLRLNATSVLSSCRPLIRGASNQRFTTGGRNFYKNIATGESKKPQLLFNSLTIFTSLTIIHNLRFFLDEDTNSILKTGMTIVFSSVSI